MTKDERTEYNRKYYIKNKEKIIIKQKNKGISDERKKTKKIYRSNHLEENRISSRNYREKNKEKIKLYFKSYFKKYNENRINNDPQYKLTISIRKRIRESLKYSGFKKKTKTTIILGCSFNEFKEHIEKQFEPWMNWNNYGNPKDGIFEPNKTWDIDHIIPVSSAISEEELIKLNHYSNLKPLCSYYNRWVKGNKKLRG